MSSLIGDLTTIPANTSHSVVWNKPGNAVSIAIAPTVFARTIYEVVNPDRIKLLPQFATAEPLVHQIGLALNVPPEVVRSAALSKLKSALVRHGSCSRLYA